MIELSGCSYYRLQNMNFDTAQYKNLYMFAYLCMSLCIYVFILYEKNMTNIHKKYTEHHCLKKH